MNYTKGEWKVMPVNVEEIGGRIPHYFITGEINGVAERTIADVGCWKDRDNAQDDAQLIASAPKLCEAVIKAYQYIMLGWGSLDEVELTLFEAAKSALSENIEALTKAEGG